MRRPWPCGHISTVHGTGLSASGPSMKVEPSQAITSRRLFIKKSKTNGIAANDARGHHPNDNKMVLFMTNPPSPIQGIIPVMLTPFTDDGQIDYAGLEKLIEWYVAKGSDALFAVCQSSEMLFLTLEERVALGRFVVEKTRGRIPVVASGHISDDIESQVRELTAMSRIGADALILVTNHLDPKKEGSAVFKATLNTLLERLPKDIPLGLYECPAPYRRLLTDEELMICAESGRFVLLKDVSCDLDTVKRRVALTAGTPLRILNANAAIAWDAMKAGAPGFNGVTPDGLMTSWISGNTRWMPGSRRLWIPWRN